MRVTNVLQTNTTLPPPPFSNLGFLRTNQKKSFPRNKKTLIFLNLPPLRRRNPNFKVVRVTNSESPMMRGAAEMLEDEEEEEEEEDGGLVLETSITRSLSPAVTLERGLDKIREEIEKLKLNPPCCTSGIYRLQVAVPPSAKALNWFCCQPQSSGVFPQFFISNETENSTYNSLSLNGTRGVFGVGAALYFTRSSSSSSCMPGGLNSIPRYLSPDSRFMMAYGFVDIKIETELSAMKNESGSFYFFIPQVELAEHDSISILTATLVWNDSSLCTFGEAVHSFELSLGQVSHHCLSTTERFANKCISTTLHKFKVVDDQTVPMVYMKDLSLDGKHYGDDTMELREASCSHQFCFRLSLDFSFASNMLNHDSERILSLREYANINTLWASLIIEECSRLGLTYFCVAPGSRSSPLAIAASTHPLTTCIACFDERSLAFHAVGYARGSQKPAVVITSSGTAVSNLLPAVVEASQDFVPLLLLTADRPPELQDAGANQAINQVNLFGSFVRYFFNLPAPTDNIPVRMILTTVDSAVYHATCSPYGPVHINCPFREPLEDTPQKWMLSCLKGLDFWMSSAEPMTKYMKVSHSHTYNDAKSQISEVLEVIQGAKQGLLLIGAIHTEDEIWAALLLAKHLLWPAVADILSGLRLRKLLTSFSEHEENFLFVDHLDHALLSDFVRNWAKADVIIQIGSRITSKRISQMLEECFPLSYIMVDKHPCRHDPLHIVTHRIQNTIAEFSDCLFKTQFPPPSGKWSCFLHALNAMIAWEMSFQICSNKSLTEPYVAHVISKGLSSDSALFMGNSMVIRDADMYGHKWAEENHSVSAMMLSLKLPCHWLHVAGNRGASGIDGLLSTAIGFAVGCKKRVLCVLGDVSFLHDTNGLAILNQRMWRKPMTIIVINNHGGAIFSLLPIADRTEQKILDQYFYTSHTISIRELCVAHGVKHLQVQTKMELQDALFTSQREDRDHVIEVESSIDANATFHSSLKKFACQAADDAVSILSKILVADSISCSYFLCKIQRLEYSLYRVSLCAPLTSNFLNMDPSKFHREGFILTLSLEDGSVGFGEVAPLDTREENLLNVEDQLKFLLHVIKGAKISYLLPLLKGSFSSWIWSSLGVPPCSIFPSVRCGLEMAILNAIAAMQGFSLLNVLNSHTSIEEATSNRSSRVKVCALLDSTGTPMEVAHAAVTLVEEGFSAIKLKVARRADPLEDAAVIWEVRKKVGHQTELRADANRKWTYEEAIRFGFSVKNCNMQYIEEPVQNEEDIIRFCEETGLTVALDETIDNIQGDPLKMLAKFTHAGIAAVVIKPSVVGGFENSALIARWAQQQGKMVVISAAFESSLGLSAYIQFCSYLELQNADIHRMMNKEPTSSVAHGLGTYKWLEEDVTVNSLKIGFNPCSGSVEASVADANCLLQKCQINHKTILKSFSGNQVRTYRLNVDSESLFCQIKVQEIESSIDNHVLLFVHGFLGTGEEWMPIMKAISGAARCITFDLPGHGESTIESHAGGKAVQEPRLSIEAISDILYKLIQYVSPRKVTLIGYSMGARIALYMALKYSDMIEGAVIISGSPGLKDEVERKIRRDKDDSRARSLVVHGLHLFLDTWYTGYLWKSLRGHPNFNEIVASRLQHEDVQSLAKALSDSSIGRQQPLWEDLKLCRTPLLLIVGEEDNKFKTIAKDMLCELGHVTWSENDPRKEIHDMVEVPKSGHAVHLENPLPVIRALRKFLTILERSSIPKERSL